MTVCEAHILPLTKSMPINTSEKVKASRKSHTVLSCLTSAEYFITPDFVGTLPLDSVRFRRLHPTDSTTIFDQADDYQEKASLSVSEQVPHEKSRSSSRKSAAGTVLTVFGSSAGHSFGKPQRDCVSETSLLSQLAGPRVLGSGSVSTTDQPLMTGKRDRGESIFQSMRDRENLQKILERKAESSIQGENEAQKKLSEIEADVDIRRWEQRSSEIALHESYRELETQRLQVLQANIWDNAQSERISLCGELEMRNKLFQESRTKDCQEIEELRRRCCEESDRARQAKLDELSMMQQRDPQTVSQLLAQMRESQDKANSLSDAREFHDPETAGSSGASHVTSPPLTNPSYRTVPRRDSGLPPETLNMMGISDVFERLPAREGQPQNISKNHGIWHLLLVE